MNIKNGILNVPKHGNKHDLIQFVTIYVFSYFPFGFEGRIWDLIVSVPDRCLSFALRVHNPCPGFCCGS